MMGLIFAKLWSLFCNQGEPDGAAQRLESEAEGLYAEGDSWGDAGISVDTNVLRRREVT